MDNVEQENTLKLREIALIAVTIISLSILFLHTENKTVEWVILGLGAFVAGMNFPWQNKV